jgi:hypothetical protein
MRARRNSADCRSFQRSEMMEPWKTLFASFVQAFIDQMHLPCMHCDLCTTRRSVHSYRT